MSKAKQGQALGVGGVFFRSADPAKLGTWYQQHLGFDIEDWGGTNGASFSPSTMPPNAFTVWGAFSADTEYFGDPQQAFMINIVVDDLEAALANVAAGGARVVPETEDHDYGRFGWFEDPEGNRVELWEPPADPPSAGQTEEA
jgi:predicted enzyme related to lactoylglutathione lyase